eukprot:GHVO01067074.1.p1 GENE.GHVO01067074.1~~GHVO01067074.1.p1  ORF type:complete len:133 (+),score=20.19 GHVO01067074.1:34-432(+)
MRFPVTFLADSVKKSPPLPIYPNSSPNTCPFTARRRSLTEEQFAEGVEDLLEINRLYMLGNALIKDETDGTYQTHQTTETPETDETDETQQISQSRPHGHFPPMKSEPYSNVKSEPAPGPLKRKYEESEGFF